LEKARSIFGKEKMRQIKIYLDPTSEVGLKLVNYATNNVQDLVFRAKIRIKFVIVDKKIKKNLGKEDVEQLPAMKLQNEWFMGASSIKRELVSLSRKSKGLPTPESVDDMLVDYQRNQVMVPLNQEGKFVDPTTFDADEGKVNLQDKFRMEMESRGFTDPEQNAENAGVNLTRDERKRQDNRPQQTGAQSYLDMEMGETNRPRRPKNVKARSESEHDQLDADIMSGIISGKTDADAILLAGLLEKSGGRDS
jgi:hypothetical protein